MPDAVIVSVMRESEVSSVCEMARCYLGKNWQLSELLQDQQNSFAQYWVLRRRGTDSPCAFMQFWHIKDEVELIALAVEPAYRRLGCGQRLLDELRVFCGRQNVAHILLEVRASNTSAINFYLASGFLKDGLRKAYYTDNGEDARTMSLVLR